MYIRKKRTAILIPYCGSLFAFLCVWDCVCFAGVTGRAHFVVVIHCVGSSFTAGLVVVFGHEDVFVLRGYCVEV